MYLIPSIVIIVSLAIILFIVGRKFPQVAAVDLETLPQKREAFLKEVLIEERIKRKFGTRIITIKKILEPIYEKLHQLFKKFYLRIMELEQHYKEQASREKLFQEKENEIKVSLEKLLTEAKELLEEEAYKEAEKRYIEVLGLDPKNEASYKGLGELYFQQKNFREAQEVYEHLIKLSEGKVKSRSQKLEEVQALASYYFDLGRSFKALGENKKAISSFKKAAKLEANNPKILDFLLELAIMERDKALARKTFNKLKKVNPENQKLAEFKKKIDEL